MANIVGEVQVTNRHNGTSSAEMGLRRMMRGEGSLGASFFFVGHEE